MPVAHIYAREPLYTLYSLYRRLEGDEAMRKFSVDGLSRLSRATK